MLRSVDRLGPHAATNLFGIGRDHLFVRRVYVHGCISLSERQNGDEYHEMLCASCNSDCAYSSHPELSFGRILSKYKGKKTHEGHEKKVLEKKM